MSLSTGIEKGEAGNDFTGLIRTMHAQFSAAGAVIGADDLRTLIANNSFEGAIAAVTAPFVSLADTLTHASIDAAAAQATNIGQQIGQLVTIDPTAPRYVDALRVARMNFANAIRDSLSETARSVLVAGMRAGLSDEEIARQMIAAAGLPLRDEAAIRNYANTVAGAGRARTLTDSFDGKPIMRPAATPRQTGRMVSNYRELMRTRASDRLAQTQGLRATNLGRQAALEQLVDDRTIEASNIKRTWADAHDRRVRDTHRGMNGQVRGHNIPFDSPSGEQLMYPGDPNASASETYHCRCGLLISVVS